LETLDALNKDLIFLNKNFNDTNELFDFIADKTRELDLTKDSYSSALKTREESFPTALEFNDIGVAIPHADSENINREFISLVTLDKPLKFNAMEDSNRIVEVKIVFVLGLLKAENQLETLQKIMQLLQEENTLRYLNGATKISDVVNTLINQ